MSKISLKKYNFYFLAVGLAYDKRLLNQWLKSLIHTLSDTSDTNYGLVTKIRDKIKFFFTHISDATTVGFLMSKALKNKRSVILYGDVPYTHNFFIDYVYVESRDPEINKTLKQALGKYIDRGYWGYWLLSWILKEAEDKIKSKYDQSNLHIRIIGKNTEALKTLLDHACVCSLTYEQDSDKSEIMISSSKKDLGQDAIAIPIFSIISKINEDIIDELYRNFGSPKNPCFVTFGGAEHNVFLRYLISRDRKKSTKRRRIFDVHNAWDYLELKKYKDNGIPGLGISTHEYVEARIIDAETKKEKIFSRATGGISGGVIAILRNFVITNKIRGDVWIIMGAGRGGALATKLAAISAIENSFDLPTGSLITLYYKNFSAEIGDVPLIDYGEFRNRDILVLYEINKKSLSHLVRNWKIANNIIPG